MYSFKGTAPNRSASEEFIRRSSSVGYGRPDDWVRCCDEQSSSSSCVKKNRKSWKVKSTSSIENETTATLSVEKEDNNKKNLLNVDIRSDKVGTRFNNNSDTSVASLSASSIGYCRPDDWVGSHQQSSRDKKRRSWREKTTTNEIFDSNKDTSSDGRKSFLKCSIGDFIVTTNSTQKKNNNMEDSSMHSLLTEDDLTSSMSSFQDSLSMWQNMNSTSHEHNNNSIVATVDSEDAESFDDDEEEEDPSIARNLPLGKSFVTAVEREDDGRKDAVATTNASSFTSNQSYSRPDVWLGSEQLNKPATRRSWKIKERAPFQSYDDNSIPTLVCESDQSTSTNSSSISSKSTAP